VDRLKPSFIRTSMLFSVLMFATSAAVGQATISLVGTGSDAGISFSFTAPTPLNITSLQTSFVFSTCTVPAGETCGQVNYAAPGGVLRLVTIGPGGAINRTFFTACYESDGDYVSPAGSGVDPGTITVSGSTPPLVTTSAGTSGFVAGSPPVAVDPGIAVSDPSTGPLQSATASIAVNFAGSEDVLAFLNSNSTTFGNISSSYDAVNGVLTLTSSGGSATLAQWQSALAAVTYADTAPTPSAATRTITFTIIDAVGPSCGATHDVAVSGTTPVHLQTFEVE